MKSTLSAPSREGGFTLIELMVGLVLGMLTVLVIAQVLVLAEGKKRSVSMGSDAQVNGAMALYTLQREIQMSGYGATSSLDALGCQVKAQFDTNAAFTFTLAPVVINDGANDAPDTITVLRGRTTGFSAPIGLSGAHTNTDDHFAVNSSFGAVVGNMMIAVPQLQNPGTNWCALFSVTSDSASANTTLSPTVVPHVLTTTSKWNQNSVFPAAGYVKDDYLLNVGSMVSRTYSIDTNLNAYNLQVGDLSLVNGLTTTQALYPQIINLQALYGKGTVDASGNVIVDTYDNVTPLTNADWRRVVAIRIAVVARSNEYEKDVVTASQPQWDVGATATITGPATTTCHGTSKCITLKVDQLADWKHYRYKVYDAIVPLRNVLWNS